MSNGNGNGDTGGTGDTSALSTAGSSSSSTSGTAEVPVVLENPDTPNYTDYKGYNYQYMNTNAVRAYLPKMKWEIWISKGFTDKFIRPTDELESKVWDDKIMLNSGSSGRAALIDLKGTIDRTMAINTFDIMLLQNPAPTPDSDEDYKFTDRIKRNQRVKIWLGWDETEFTDSNYIFGGYITMADRINTLDDTLKITIAGFERALMWDKYRTTKSLEWIELGYLLQRLFDKEDLGHFEYANTGVIVDRYVSKNKRLSACFDELLNALDGFDHGDAPPKTYTPPTTGSDQGSGMGQLYSTEANGGKKAKYWDFWMDEYGNGNLLPVFKQSDSLHSYIFKEGDNLISLQRTQKDEYDVKGVDSYEVVIPLVPDINVYSDNLIQVQITPQKEWEKIKLQVEQIDYDMSGTMKLTCRKIAELTAKLTLASSNTEISGDDKLTLTATLTDSDGNPLIRRAVDIYYIVDQKRTDVENDVTDDDGNLVAIVEGLGQSSTSTSTTGSASTTGATTPSEATAKATFPGDEDYLDCDSNEITIRIGGGSGSGSNRSNKSTDSSSSSNTKGKSGGQSNYAHSYG